MQVISFKFFEDCLNEDFSDINDDETVEEGNQLFSTTLRLVLQIKASNNSIIDSKLADAKTTLESTLGTSAFFLPWDTHPTKYETAKGVKAVPSKEKLKYLKGYKVFSNESAQVRTVYVRFVLRFKEANLSKDYFNDICQDSLNNFTSSTAGGWITNFCLASCTSDATQPCIICLLVNVSQEYEDSDIFLQLLQEITGDSTLGLKFNSYSGPKALTKKISSADWTLKKVLRVEGERKTAEKSAKALDTYFKRNLLLGSRVQVVNTSKSKWASSSKGKKAFIDGMNTQIALNDRLLSYDLDDATFGNANSHTIAHKSNNVVYRSSLDNWHSACTPLHHYTTTPLHHYTTTPLHHYTTTPLHHYTTTPLHHYTTTPLHHYTTLLDIQ